MDNRFTQSDHLQLETHLGAYPGAQVLINCTGGETVALTHIEDYNPSRIVGIESDGSLVTLFTDCLSSWSLIIPEGSATEAPPEPVDPEAEDAALDEYARLWNGALMALRAACEKSADQDVADAVAALEAIELQGPVV